MSEPPKMPKFDPAQARKYFTSDFMKKHIDLDGRGKKQAEKVFMQRLKTSEKVLQQIQTKLESAFTQLAGKKQKLKPLADLEAARSQLDDLEKQLKKCQDKETAKQVEKTQGECSGLLRKAKAALQWRNEPMSTVLCVSASQFKLLAAEIYKQQAAGKTSGSFVTITKFPYWQRGSRDGKGSELKRAQEGSGRAKLGVKASSDGTLQAYHLAGMQ